MRPQRSLRATHRQGAKSQLIPAQETSSAVARPISSTSRGFRVVPRLMLRGEDDGIVEAVVAVNDIDTIDERNAQRRGERDLLGAVVHVGPGHGRVRRGLRAAPGEQRAEPHGGDVLGTVDPRRSACIIWPSLSSRDIDARRSAIRTLTGHQESLQAAVFPAQRGDCRRQQQPGGRRADAQPAPETPPKIHTLN